MIQQTHHHEQERANTTSTTLNLKELAKSRAITADDFIDFMSKLTKSSAEEAKKKYESDEKEKKEIDEIVKEYNEKKGNPMTNKMKVEVSRKSMPLKVKPLSRQRNLKSLKKTKMISLTIITQKY